MKLSVPRDTPRSPKLAAARRSEMSTSWKPVSTTELSESWFAWGAQYGLQTFDLVLLRAQDPVKVDRRTLEALSKRLGETLASEEWERCAVLLGLLVRSDLAPAVGTTAAYDRLEALAKLAALSGALRTADAAGTTARLGRVLLVQLLGIANSLDRRAP